MGKELFLLSIDKRLAITDTDYYKWLVENEKSRVHRRETKMKYLNSLGFDITKHRLNSNDLQCLNMIEGHYAYKLHNGLLNGDN